MAITAIDIFHAIQSTLHGSGPKGQDTAQWMEDHYGDVMPLFERAVERIEARAAATVGATAAAKVARRAEKAAARAEVTAARASNYAREARRALDQGFPADSIQVDPMRGKFNVVKGLAQFAKKDSYNLDQVNLLWNERSDLIPDVAVFMSADGHRLSIVGADQMGVTPSEAQLRLGFGAAGFAAGFVPEHAKKAAYTEHSYAVPAKLAAASGPAPIVMLANGRAVQGDLIGETDPPPNLFSVVPKRSIVTLSPLLVTAVLAAWKARTWTKKQFIHASVRIIPDYIALEWRMEWRGLHSEDGRVSDTSGYDRGLTDAVVIASGRLERASEYERLREVGLDGKYLLQMCQFAHKTGAGALEIRLMTPSSPVLFVPQGGRSLDALNQYHVILPIIIDREDT